MNGGSLLFKKESKEDQEDQNDQDDYETKTRYIKMINGLASLCTRAANMFDELNNIMFNLYSRSNKLDNRLNRLFNDSCDLFRNDTEDDVTDIEYETCFESTELDLSDSDDYDFSERRIPMRHMEENKNEPTSLITIENLDIRMEMSTIVRTRKQYRPIICEVPVNEPVIIKSRKSPIFTKDNSKSSHKSANLKKEFDHARKNSNPEASQLPGIFSVRNIHETLMASIIKGVQLRNVSEKIAKTNNNNDVKDALDKVIIERFNDFPQLSTSTISMRPSDDDTSCASWESTN